MSSIVLMNKDLVRAAVGADILSVKQVVQRALRVHHEQNFVQPTKVYLQESDHEHTADRIIAMPAHIKGHIPISGLKWIGSKHTNPLQGLNRATALIVLNDPYTNAPIAIMDGTLISALRTVAISLIAIDRLRPNFRTMAILGMGRLGRMHAEFIAQHYPSVTDIKCFSQHAPFDDLVRDINVVRKVSTFEEALSGTDVVVTTTTVAQPYIEPRHVTNNQLLINLSLMDFGVQVFVESDVVVDDWSACRHANKVLKTAIDQGLVLQADVHTLSEILFGSMKDKPFVGRTMVNPLGMAIEDLMVAWEVYAKIKDDPSVPTFEIE